MGTLSFGRRKIRFNGERFGRDGVRIYIGSAEVVQNVVGTVDVDRRTRVIAGHERRSAMVKDWDRPNWDSSEIPLWELLCSDICGSLH